MNCPRCKRRCVSIGIDGKIKIRTNIVVFQKSENQSAIIVCRKCGCDVPVDLRIGENLQKAITPRLILRKIDIKS